jgi:hypothetical protein
MHAAILNAAVVICQHCKVHNAGVTVTRPRLTIAVDVPLAVPLSAKPFGIGFADQRRTDIFANKRAALQIDRAAHATL